MLDFQLKKQLGSGPGRLNLNLGFSVAAGEVVGLVGPSGAGKTSVLRMLSGLMRPDHGLIKFDGALWFNEQTVCTPPDKRNVGLVFQDYPLFPHMSVLGNLCYAADIKRPDQRVRSLVERLDLEPVAEHYPRELSGGQRQRAAIGRAVVRNPRLLLFDEPFSALDSGNRANIKTIIKELLAEASRAAIIVTHNPEDLRHLATYIYSIENGQMFDHGPAQKLLP